MESKSTAEIQPPEVQVNGGGVEGVGGASAAIMMTTSDTVGSKRQRRPSVRLGDIGGDHPYDSHVRRANKPWRLSLDHRKDPNLAGKSSKTRQLMNLSSSGGGIGNEYQETLEIGGDEEKEGNLDSLAIGSWRLKESKKRGTMATKRVRSNWISSKIDEGGGGGVEGEDIDDVYRDFDMENSESPLKEQSPMNSLDILGVDGHGNEREVAYHGNRRGIRGRLSEPRDHDGVELSGPSDADPRDWNHRNGGGGGRGRSCGGCGGGGSGNGGEDGVRIWLNALGLGRYAPVFEIHEVDDEVLPMLTLEDLKDMGISAVGSRRKMFCAIQKLGKGFS